MIFKLFSSIINVKARTFFKHSASNQALHNYVDIVFLRS